jgi:hypothetical protein
MKYVLILAATITITLSSQAVARLGNTELAATAQLVNARIPITTQSLTRTSLLITADELLRLVAWLLRRD